MNKSKSKSFGAFARRQRQIASLSQSDVAQAIGCTDRGVVSKKEAGILRWSLDDMCALARLLGTTVAYLIRIWEAGDIEFPPDQTRPTGRPPIHSTRQIHVTITLPAEYRDWLLARDPNLSQQIRAMIEREMDK
jgi:transcriptional regulator with XRE-family HTH domain